MAPTTSTTIPVASSNCAATDAVPPEGAAVVPTIDVDGDDRGDRLWLASPAEGPRAVGVTTASGAGGSAPVPLAGPVPLRALLVDVDQRPPAEILVSDGRAVLVFAFADCTVQPVVDDAGDQLRLDLGFGLRGTGVGCVDTDLDGTRELVSLRRDTHGPDVVEWTRTVVHLDGTRASTGPTDTGVFTEPEDHVAIELLSSVSCGAIRLADGVTEPRA